MRVKTPNDRKLSDTPERRGTCEVGGKAVVEAGAVTRRRVRCSAWLGVAIGELRMANQRPKRCLSEAPRNPLEAAQHRGDPASPAGGTAENEERMTGGMILETDRGETPFMEPGSQRLTTPSSATRRSGAGPARWVERRWRKQVP